MISLSVMTNWSCVKIDIIKWIHLTITLNIYGCQYIHIIFPTHFFFVSFLKISHNLFPYTSHIVSQPPIFPSISILAHSLDICVCIIDCLGFYCISYWIVLYCICITHIGLYCSGLHYMIMYSIVHIGLYCISACSPYCNPTDCHNIYKYFGFCWWHLDVWQKRVVYTTLLLIFLCICPLKKGLH